jgi:hypothetical protein
MARVHALENFLQIKAASFMTEIEMTLHGQRWPGRFSFYLFLRHRKTFRRGGERLPV